MIDWQAIVQKHGPAVWQTAYRLLGNHTDAADCFQETFIAALQISRQQRVRNFSTLLARLATHRAIDRLRQRTRQSRDNRGLAERNGTQSKDLDPARQVEQQELAVRLREAIGDLPLQEAQVFCLRYLNDMSYRQIAKELDIETNATGVLLHRAKAKLRNSLELPPTGEK